MKELNPFGNKFTNVSRIRALSDAPKVEVYLDVNCELYPLSVGDKVFFVITTTLNTDGSTIDPYKKETWSTCINKATLADDYEYVMYGKVYKYEEHKTHSASVYASFGGLLLCLSGESHQLQHIKLGMNIYLLLR